MPPDSWCGYFVSNPVRPTTRISSSMLVPASRGAPPRLATRSRKRPMLLATLSHGIRFACWNTRPMRPAWRKLRGGAPPTVTVPRVGAIRSATTLRSVLLPQPEGPTSETNAPSGIVQRDPGQRLDRLGAADAVDDIDIRHRNCGTAADWRRARVQARQQRSPRQCVTFLTRSASVFASSRLSTIALVYISLAAGFLARSVPSAARISIDDCHLASFISPNRCAKSGVL